MSVDLWKTIAVWLTKLAEEIDAPFRMKFALLTTADAPDKSAASLLRMRDRDEVAADKLLWSRQKLRETSQQRRRARPTQPCQSMSGLAYCDQS